MVYQNTKLWTDTAKFGQEALKELAKILPALRAEFYSHESLRDNECGDGRCILAN